MNDDEGPFEKRLTLGWQALSPPADLKDRVRAQLAVAPAGGPPTLRGARWTSRWRALKASGALGTGAVGLLLGLGFVAGWFSRTEWNAPPVRQGSEAEPTTMALDAAQRAAEHPVPRASGQREVPPGPAESGSVPRTAASPKPRLPARSAKRPANPVAGAVPARTSDTDRVVNQELALIERAERALRSKNGELALALSAELDEKYPSTTLHEERQAIALMARCQSGSPDRFDERERFSRRYPSSVYVDRIVIECGRDAALPAPSRPLE